MKEKKQKHRDVPSATALTTGWEDPSSCTLTVGNTGLLARHRAPRWMRRTWVWSFNGVWCGLYDRIGNKDVYRHPRSRVCLGTMDVYSLFLSNSVAEGKSRNPQFLHRILQWTVCSISNWVSFTSDCIIGSIVPCGFFFFCGTAPEICTQVLIFYKGIVDISCNHLFES